MKIHQGFAHRVCSRQLVTEPSLIGEFSALPTGEDERTDRGGRGDDSNSLGEHGFLHPNRYTRQRACRLGRLTLMVGRKWQLNVGEQLRMKMAREDECREPQPSTATRSPGLRTTWVVHWSCLL